MIVPKSYREIFAEDPGHAYVPPTYEYTVDVVHLSDGSEETVTVMMKSNNEWREHIKRVVALRYGWNEKNFRVAAFYRSFGEG